MLTDLRVGIYSFELIRQGHIKPLHICKVFPFEETVDAFRYMQHGKHIGKIVISYENSKTVKLPVSNSDEKTLMFILVNLSRSDLPFLRSDFVQMLLTSFRVASRAFVVVLPSTSHEMGLGISWSCHEAATKTLHPVPQSTISTRWAAMLT